MVSKDEWAAIKASHNNRCVICGKSERRVGILEQVHIKSRWRRKTQVLPMCRTHHKMYDQNELSATQLKKIRQTPAMPKHQTPSEISRKIRASREKATLEVQRQKWIVPPPYW
jgi:predicted restriction endonuclease